MRQLPTFVPPPEHWQSFQDLIASLSRTVYVPDSVQLYGRTGQAQRGVDVYALDHTGRNIGIQCKESKKPTLTRTLLLGEAQKATAFRPTLQQFILAVTTPRDTKLQDAVNDANAKGMFSFGVQIWFWDDINDKINRSYETLTSYYAAFAPRLATAETRHHVECIRQAFDRPAFRDDFSVERNYSDFEIALVRLKALIRIGILQDHAGNLVLSTVPLDRLQDQTYAAAIRDVEAGVEKIYQTYLRDKKLTRDDHRRLEDRAGEYNILRRRVVQLLNNLFQLHGLRNIDTQYGA